MKPTSSLDPRAPLVLDIRELGRRPGSMRRVERTVPAPADLRTGLAGVPVGAAVEMRLRLESVMEGVLVSGTARAPLAGQCARCLDPMTGNLEVELQELYVYQLDEREDDEELQVDGDLLDLEPVVRDAVVLGLPFTPLCTPDCPGLCPTCGDRLTEAGPEHRHELADLRWAALQALAVPTSDLVHDPTQES